MESRQKNDSQFCLNWDAIRKPVGVRFGGAAKSNVIWPWSKKRYSEISPSIHPIGGCVMLIILLGSLQTATLIFHDCNIPAFCG